MGITDSDSISVLLLQNQSHQLLLTELQLLEGDRVGSIRLLEHSL